MNDVRRRTVQAECLLVASLEKRVDTANHRIAVLKLIAVPDSKWNGTHREASLACSCLPSRSRNSFARCGGRRPNLAAQASVNLFKRIPAELHPVSFRNDGALKLFVTPPFDVEADYREKRSRAPYEFRLLNY
jgi:hypothetical protein